MRFRDNPNTTLQELQRDVKNVVKQLKNGAEAFVLGPVDIATTSTPVSHGLNFVPRAALMVPTSLVTFCQSASPDANNVYFQASSACTAMVFVFP